MKPSYEYIAGIIDGEGYIGITRACANEHLNVVVAVSMTDPRVPYALKEVYGGSVVETSRKENHKNVFTWKVWAKKAEYCLETIEPFLVVKLDQCKTALELRHSITGSGIMSRGISKNRDKDQNILVFRNSLKEKINKLNKRGVLVNA